MLPRLEAAWHCPVEETLRSSLPVAVAVSVAVLLDAGSNSRNCAGLSWDVNDDSAPGRPTMSLIAHTLRSIPGRGQRKRYAACRSVNPPRIVTLTGLTSRNYARSIASGNKDMLADR